MYHTFLACKSPISQANYTKNTVTQNTWENTHKFLETEICEIWKICEIWNLWNLAEICETMNEDLSLSSCSLNVGLSWGKVEWLFLSLSQLQELVSIQFHFVDKYLCSSVVWASFKIFRFSLLHDWNHDVNDSQCFLKCIWCFQTFSRIRDVWHVGILHTCILCVNPPYCMQFTHL